MKTFIAKKHRMKNTMENALKNFCFGFAFTEGFNKFSEFNGIFLCIRLLDILVVKLAFEGGI